MEDGYQQLLHAWCVLVDEIDEYFETRRNLIMAQAFADRLFDRLIEPLQNKYGVDVSRKAANEAFKAFDGISQPPVEIKAPDKDHRRPRLVVDNPDNKA